MTQVKDMKNVELNKALAELIGYKIKSTNTVPEFYRLIDPAGNTVVGETFDNELIVWAISAPQYCTDVVASLEVQAKAIDVDADRYVSNLDVIVNPIAMHDNWQKHEIACLLHATPRQRAEAAYMTLSQIQGGTGA